MNSLGESALRPKRPFQVALTLRPSLLDLDVPLSVHPAPDILGMRLAPVQVVMAALMNSH